MGRERIPPDCEKVTRIVKRGNRNENAAFRMGDFANGLLANLIYDDSYFKVRGLYLRFSASASILATLDTINNTRVH
jgi:hypothetical protein